MFDRIILSKIKPFRRKCAQLLYRGGFSPNGISVTGAIIGFIAAIAISLQYYLIGLLCICVNRIFDGLDGPLAQEYREKKKPHSSRLGGYLDSVCDFLFYASIPIAFILADLARNTVIGIILLFSFFCTAVTFLVYAAVSVKVDSYVKNKEKSFSYLWGGAEGFETIVFFVLICIFPSFFPVLAGIFAILCFFTAGSRIWYSVNELRNHTENSS